MILDIESVNNLFQFLQTKLKDDNLNKRAKCYGNFDNLVLIINKRIQLGLAKIQRDELAKVKLNIAKDESGILGIEEVIFLKNQSSVISSIVNYQALLLCVVQAFQHNLNGCQEHASIISLAFMHLYGVNKGPCVENLMLALSDEHLNHELVVWNRKSGSKLQDVSSWGIECLVFDSWGGWHAKIEQLPSNTALNNLRLGGALSGITVSVLHQNDLNLNILTEFKAKPNHPLHNLEQFTLEFLTTEMQKFVNDTMSCLGMPLLSFLPSTSLTQFFPTRTDSSSTNDAFPDLTVAKIL